MENNLLASIIINNYNYDKFIGEAINSALHQTYINVEVIVVDDGSTDRSREIISQFGDKIIPLLKQNGGQASAFNAGFEKSSGDVVFFLDSDDVLFPGAVENVIELFTESAITKVHWPLAVVDKDGVETGILKPAGDLPQGNFKDVVLQGGPTSCISSPTSGNAWSRQFLQKVFPMPEDVAYYKTCADEYLYTIAPVFGEIKAINKPQGFYRVHGKNIYSALSFEEKLKLELDGHGQQTEALSDVLERNGIVIDKELWRRNSWFHKLKRTIDYIAANIPSGDAFIMVDNGTLPVHEIFPHHKVLPFVERNGKFWGLPEDDEVALREFKRLHKGGAKFIVFTWPCFWWLQYYTRLGKYLERFDRVEENEAFIVFDISKNIETGNPFISIIVNNYNYGRFLNDAVNSALNQTYENIEVIVVDDGSTDNSKETITQYGNRIIPVLKENGGQGSAFNAGFKLSTGQIIIFLDSDDMLAPKALEKIVKEFESDPVKVHWLLNVMDENGIPTGNIIPSSVPPDGDLKNLVLSDGPFYDWHLTPPTSGNAWSRWFLEKVLPLPEKEFIISADEYLLTLSPIFGSSKTIAEPIGFYRIHGRNNYFQKKLDEDTLASYMKRFEACCAALQKHFAFQGIDVDPQTWKEKNFNYLWLQKLLDARKDIFTFIPEHTSFILIDGNELANQFVENYTIIPFLELDGQYWGAPENDKVAITELNRLKNAGIGFLVFWWTAFWWLDHYQEFYCYVQSTHPCIIENDRVVIYDLRKEILTQ